MVPETVLTRLIGSTEVEDAFERLDTLTKEETLMAVTRNLVVTHHVDDNVMAVKGIVHNINDNVEAIKEVIHNVKASQNGTHRFPFIFTCSDPSRFVPKTAIEQQAKRSLHPDGAIIWPSTLKHIYRDQTAETASRMALGS